MKTVKTARGQSINMSALAEKQGDTRAISNVPVNARGDIIDSRGEVKVSREKITKEYYKAEKKSAEDVSIKQDSEDAKENKITILNETERTREDGSKYVEIEYSDGSMGGKGCQRLRHCLIKF